MPQSAPRFLLERGNSGNREGDGSSSYMREATKVINYVSTISGDKVQSFTLCLQCSQAIETSTQQSHQRECTGRDQALDNLTIKEIDRIVAHYDSKMGEIYTKLHLFAANYLSKYSVGTCAIVETAILKPCLDSISTLSLDIIEKSIRDIDYNKQSILSSQSRTADYGCDQSVATLLTAFVIVARQKLATLKDLPQKLRQLIQKIKDVDIQTNFKLEELKAWKSKCYAMSTYSTGRPSQVGFCNNQTNDFHRESFIKKLVELKLLVQDGNPNKYVFATREYEEVVRRNLDFQSAIDFMQDRYLTSLY